MANGLSGMVRRWRHKLRQRPPSRFGSLLSNLGLALLMLGAVLVTFYVARHR